ncbi:carboxylating nicotinate-nucleotide diphosphorylase [Calidifontibacter sp. DB0510]|uniref:Nicotinate-nucleotide pyrophosphorylase [carboxylating] n=1 Tax=Metallococcus carri TaxID=1656884 RepID=A0A967AWF8_9MICO|nr:carboxylating nicotinate-nucleotide diphosphorylase [Metallococcus carri]NHN54201.1 carboxylating nicotinate-nucleotide diphosphorylase [Metallococcus carri]NOP36959.1 carboxylating nicotinate-nucleotide diphosphorylase [Calidifontibacter sp. DB2511S]
MNTEMDRVVRTALAEDLGLVGDLTTMVTVPAEATGTAYVMAREAGVLSGTTCADATFAQVDPEVTVTWHRRDGDKLTPGDVVGEFSGSARSILTGERTALNLLGHLSGIATRTAEMVALVDGTKARIADTRKTTPGLRALEKRAVADGGGINHRFGLHDAILVKDNHIGLGGGLGPVLQRLANHTSHLVRVEIEVDTLEQLEQVLAFDAARLADGLPQVVHAILLDNMSPAQVAEGVRRVRQHPARVVTEVSGGVTEASVRALADAGPDVISVGALTHSVRCLDFGLDLLTNGTVDKKHPKG